MDDPSTYAFGLACCISLSIQCGLHPVLVHSFTDSSVIKTTIIIVTECMKIVMAAAVLMLYETPKSRESIWRSFDMKNSFKYAALPAISYAVQNLLTQYGYDKVDGTTFNILNQTKTIFAALFLYIHLGKKQSKVQIFALGILLVAAGILSLNTDGAEAAGSADRSDYHLGCMLVILASAISGLSGSLSQVALTSLSTPRHTAVFTIELAVYGMFFLFARLLYAGDETRVLFNKGFFHGWTSYTMIPVFSNAVGGILAGAVIKYAGAVMKGFALILGLMLTGFAECYGGEKTMGWPDVLSASLVCLAIYLHSRYPHASPPHWSSPRHKEYMKKQKKK